MNKILISLLTITFLTSCATTKNSDKEKEVSQASDKTISDMNMSIMSLSQMTKNMDNMKGMMSKIEKIDYQYSNPAGLMDMKIEYILDDKGKISQLSITSNKMSGFLEGFNIDAQKVLIGKTLEEASNINILAGSSLTTNAFKEAIKSQL